MDLEMLLFLDPANRSVAEAVNGLFEVCVWESVMSRSSLHRSIPKRAALIVRMEGNMIFCNVRGSALIPYSVDPLDNPEHELLD